MKIVAFAAEYVQRNNLKKTPIYSAVRFAKYLSDMDVKTVTTGHLTTVKERCQADGLSQWTIKGTLKDLRTLIRASGRDIKTDRIKTPEPKSKPVSFAVIDSIWPRLPEWCQQWLVVSYWTALRLEDSIRLQQSLTGTEEFLEIVASKTGHRQRWPITDWLRQYLQPIELPYGGSLDWSASIVRTTLKAASGTSPVLPNHIRDRSLNEWYRLGVGDLVHGSGLHKLGVMRHYIDPLEQLATVAPRLAVPSCIRSVPESVTTEESLLANFRALDPAAKTLISATAERLAGT
jgi:hypothetical protein